MVREEIFFFYLNKYVIEMFRSLKKKEIVGLIFVFRKRYSVEGVMFGSSSVSLVCLFWFRG